ncbi:MAG: glycosyltransferase family 2 protein [Planctomycetota bacterium]
MKIGIVTISFNQGQFLEQCIKSVVDQRYPNLEYIIVDPGSTDGSREIINRYSRFFAHTILEPDKGPADGLNKGFALATGDIFGFLNADDVLLPGSLNIVARAFQERPDAAAIVGHSLILDENGIILRKSYSDQPRLRAIAYGGAVLMQASTFFKATYFRQSSGFNIENRSNWDGELFIEMLLKGHTFRMINKFLSGYRVHSQSITGSKKLHEQIQQYQARMFRRIMGRDRRVFDRYIALYYLAQKYIRRPASLCERLLHGPVYGRKRVAPKGDVCSRDG